jgi:competence protein ComEC
MRLAWIVALCCFTAVFGFSADKNLEIYWIDTEGGAATLIVSPSGESVLVDSGNPGERDAKRIFETASKVAGLKQIDFLVTTHYHIDHFGGAAELAVMMPIKAVYDNGAFEGQTEKPTKQYQLFPTDKRAVINPGDELPLKASEPALKIKCIGTRKQFIAPPAGAEKKEIADPKRKGEDKSDNANSVVLLLSFGDFQMYMAGDVTWNIEEKLVNPVNLVGVVDLYQVTHHGLDVSNNPLVVNALQPTVALMTNGTTKGCGAETCATLKATKSIEAIYQSHKNLRPDSENNTAPEFIANMEKECAGHFIRASVNAAEKTYTIAIPAHKHERTFKMK